MTCTITALPKMPRRLSPPMARFFSGASATTMSSTEDTPMQASPQIFRTSTGSHAFHSVGPNRRGVNNATEYQKLFEREICFADKNKEFMNGCSLWWVSTHYRYPLHSFCPILFPSELVPLLDCERISPMTRMQKW